MRARTLLASTLLLASCTRVGGDPVVRGPLSPSPPPPAPAALAVWSSLDLPQALLDEAPNLPGVVAWTPVVTGTFDLRAVSGAGAHLRARPRGAILPVSVAAIDPAPLARTGEMAALGAALARNRAALTSSSARLRQLAPGDALWLAGEKGARGFRVGAILPESNLISEEVILPLRAAGSLGLGRPRAMVLAVEVRAWEAVAAAIRARLAASTARVDGYDLEPFPARVGTLDAVGKQLSYLLPAARVKLDFGEFWFLRGRGRRVRIDPAWVARNIVQVSPPLLGTIKCHRDVVPQLTGAMRELSAAGLGDLVGPGASCWSARMQYPNSGALSRHAFGIAVDINSSRNRYGRPPVQDRRLVRVMERWGFAWGGRWTVPDGMHFEFVRRPAR
ncbi:MAG: M15 family metallopeptidase [Acidobacteria bacterium]|nr:M15 family metallopeptidase [Acidobacteriota bacterium]